MCFAWRRKCGSTLAESNTRARHVSTAQVADDLGGRLTKFDARRRNESASKPSQRCSAMLAPSYADATRRSTEQATDSFPRYPPHSLPTPNLNLAPTTKALELRLAAALSARASRRPPLAIRNEQVSLARASFEWLARQTFGPKKLTRHKPNQTKQTPSLNSIQTRARDENHSPPLHHQVLREASSERASARGAQLNCATNQGRAIDNHVARRLYGAS